MIKFKAQGVSIDMLFCSLHYMALPRSCNVHVEVFAGANTYIPHAIVVAGGVACV